MDYKHTPFADNSLALEDRLDWLINELTLDEKLHLLASGSGGIDRLGIPPCYLGGEAAHGVEARNDQNGIGDPDDTTSFPQPIGMSSSWDTEIIKEAGNVVGREARAVYHKRKRGGLSRWAPTIDLLRDPRWGRNEEAYGEDPVQVGAMSAAYIRGMQGDDPNHYLISSTLKHFYANNTEIGRGWKNSSISPRNRYELYLEPFRRAIEDGGAEGVMTAYNRVNGLQGLFDDEVKYILKDEFGLGHGVSDGGAMELAASFSHVTAMNGETIASSIKAGVDAMSGRPEAVYKAAVEAYELGLLTEADMDTAIRNTFRMRLKLGIYDANPVNDYNDITEAELCSEESSKVCKALTDASLVLLKNDGILPLEVSAFHKDGKADGSAISDGTDSADDIILIGPMGDKWYQDWYGGSAPVHVSLLEGLNTLAGDGGEQSEATGASAGSGEASKRTVRYVDGCDRIRFKFGDKYLASGDDGKLKVSETPETFIMEDWGEGSYTFRSEATGKYMITRLEDRPVEGIAVAEEDGGSGSNIKGTVYADSDRIFSWFDLEVFRIPGEGILQDRFGNPLYIDADGCSVVAVETTGAGSAGDVRNGSGDDAGESINKSSAGSTITIEIASSGIEKAVHAAGTAKTVIMALGANPMVNAKEEIDRSTIEFIPYQQKLFDAVHEANPNVVVVLMCNYPFAINEINDKARAILWSATGSQFMGQSIADALIGKVHPAGRLTQTWFKSDDDLPDIDDYDIIGGGRTYRYFKGDVLYPFGYGLTYTEFEYSDMKVSVPGDMGGSDLSGMPDIDSSRGEGVAGPGENASHPDAGRNYTDSYTVRNVSQVYAAVKADTRIINVGLTITNKGAAVSDEVVQIYMKAPATGAARPDRQLIAFKRVKDIAPGLSRQVSFDIPVRELAYYDVASYSMIIEKGDYLISAGPSSAELKVCQEIFVDGRKPGIRDVTGRIPADHYDEQTGSQIVEGRYGYKALMPGGNSVYDASPNGHISATYGACDLPGDIGYLCIHGYAPEDVEVTVYIDEIRAGSLKFNTGDYERIPSVQRNHMPRAEVDHKARLSSWPRLWANVYIPVDMNAVRSQSLIGTGGTSEDTAGVRADNEHVRTGSGPDHGQVHRIRIEACGAFKYDWFMIMRSES